ncbi:hypothetical protein CQA53_01325 [Helicobacter didelphidarum]|uniref:NAD kinase n=1 Tax=Helicobacter didelphidarum TaxID=2040648 RepID=A0A3D8IQY3_9HELI|nr:NAD(+)/NADH kinase [Helicobacter didelphidarum]RDU67669.1 hypothetical protein CQA53_01325 [Helicobacter didelphidarum]
MKKNSEYHNDNVLSKKISAKNLTNHNKVNTIGIVLRPYSIHIQPIFLDIYHKLIKANIKVILESSSAKMLDISSVSIEVCSMKYICKHADMLFSIGGDGTLLSSARKSYGSEIAILGINSGRLGYLTITSPNEIDMIIPRIQCGNYYINRHLMLEAYIKEENRQSRKQSYFALNEFLLSHAGLGGMVEIEAYINGILFNHYRLDGLLVATPTGSSAYNISAGGSLVYPSCRNVLLTPICAHALTQRPIILNDSFTIEFKLKTNGALIADGQQKISILQGQTICIKVAEYGAMLVELEPYSYFIRLRDKLGWGQLD